MINCLLTSRKVTQIRGLRHICARTLKPTTHNNPFLVRPFSQQEPPQNHQNEKLFEYKELFDAEKLNSTNRAELNEFHSNLIKKLFGEQATKLSEAAQKSTRFELPGWAKSHSYFRDRNRLLRGGLKILFWFAILFGIRKRFLYSIAPLFSERYKKSEKTENEGGPLFMLMFVDFIYGTNYVQEYLSILDELEITKIPDFGPILDVRMEKSNIS